RHGGSGRLDLSLWRAQRARSQGIYGQSRPADSHGCVARRPSPQAERGDKGPPKGSHMGKFTLADLEKRVHERAKASAAESYTRALIEKGVAHCAKKLGEEAIETGL